MTNTTPPAAVDLTAAIDPTEMELLMQGFDATDAVEPQGETPAVPENTDTVEDTPATKEETVIPDETGADPEKKPDEDTKSPTNEQSLTPPGRYEGESDTQYHLRTDLWRAGRARATAETEEEKSLITDHIRELRKGIGQEAARSKQTKVEATQNQADDIIPETGTDTPDDEERAAKVALEKLGYLDKNQVQEIVEKALGQQRAEEAQKEHGQAISEFYKSRPDIIADASRKETLERYILDNFKITPQTSKKQLAAHLDMAASYLFPRAQRSAGASEAAAKRTVVSASQNTKYTPPDDSLAADLRKLGYSDEDIRASGW
jgi:hypothetical protein